MITTKTTFKCDRCNFEETRSEDDRPDVTIRDRKKVMLDNWGIWEEMPTPRGYFEASQESQLLCHRCWAEWKKLVSSFLYGIT